MSKRLFLTVVLAAFFGAAFAQAPQNVKYGPWITSMDESSFTVLWYTEEPGIAWVELEDGSRFYHEFSGRRIFEKLHSVKVRGLEKGTEYAYRLGLCPLEDDSSARDPKFFPERLTGFYRTGTFDNSRKECRFSVVNDMHLDIEKYRTLISEVDSLSTDFIFLNGDIASADNYTLDTLIRYEVEALRGYSQKLPVFFARGNHEGRGNNPRIVLDVFPSRTGNFYYTFRQGPAAFIVFDAGETGEQRSVAYSGTPVYESYLFEQIEWAKKAMAEPEFADAPVKICLLHVPMVDLKPEEDYKTQRWLHNNFMSLLNGAGIDLMISGDLHVFQFHGRGSMGNDFPILVNDTECRVDVECDAKGFSLNVTDREGVRKCTYSTELYPY